jgi:tetratricopeptide (TPR) repeat protein
MGSGVALFDYDNDGWNDLLIAQGHDLDTIELTSPQIHYREPMILAHNERGKKFTDVSSSSGPVFAEKWVARRLATGDLDNDNASIRPSMAVRKYEISSEDSKSHELLGKAYSRLDRLPEAREHLEKAVALTPEVASLHCMLAPVYRKLRLADKAEAEFARCSALTAPQPSTAPN